MRLISAAIVLFSLILPAVAQNADAVFRERLDQLRAIEATRDHLREYEEMRAKAFRDVEAARPYIPYPDRPPMRVEIPPELPIPPSPPSFICIGDRNMLVCN